MSIMLHISMLLLLSVSAACSFPRPADVGDDEEPQGTIRVAPTGDDENDGFTRPIKTLKHAIGIAAEDSRVTSIVLASGRYSVAGGETFPYTLPANVRIVGPAGGGAVLAGSRTELGMVVAAGTLKDLELEDFTVAIVATGIAHLERIRVRTDMTAVRAETMAKVNMDDLDIAGASGACATGIELNGGADLTAANLATRLLGSSLVARDQSATQLAKAFMTGDTSCITSMIVVTSTGRFSMSDSLLDGGYTGVSIRSPISSRPTLAAVTNTTMRNMKNGTFGGDNAVVEMTGGELSEDQATSVNIGGGDWSLTGVTIVDSAAGVYVQQGRLTMRGCNVSRNRVGIDLSSGAVADLGSIAGPGNNVIQNSLAGLVVEGSVATSVIPAVGNTWNPVQGADAQGKYPVGTVMPGPELGASGNNIEIHNSGFSVAL